MIENHKMIPPDFYFMIYKNHMCLSLLQYCELSRTAKGEKHEEECRGLDGVYYIKLACQFAFLTVLSSATRAVVSACIVAAIIAGVVARIVAAIVAGVVAIVVSAGITAIIVAGTGICVKAAAFSECVTKCAACFWLCRRREQIQREWECIKIFAWIYIVLVWCKALFWNTSAQRLYYHIDSTEQFYDREQTQCDIYCNGCAHRCIAGIVTATATVAATATRVVAAARVFQFCGQTNDFTFCNYIRTTIGIATTIIQISSAGNIGFCRTKQCDFHGVRVGSIYAADWAAIRTSKFQSIIEYITQL